jgi:hypothetical protein
VRLIPLKNVQSIVCFVRVSKPDIKYLAPGMLYKFTLQNRPTFNNVCHFLYNSFFRNNSRIETWRNFIEIIEDDWIQVSYLYSLQVQIYASWKLGFVTNPKTSPTRLR